MNKDYLMVGQGLAGSLLAWNLLSRGKTLSIVDQDHHECSSLAAAGMINPITGKRLVLSQRCQELLPFAKDIYLKLEKLFSSKFFESKKIIRLFRNENELNEWKKKSDQTHLKQYYGQRQQPGAYGDVLNDEKGSFIIQQGGYCRKLDLLNCLTQYFKKESTLILERFDFDELQVLEDGVCFRGDHFKKIIFCEGYQAQDNPWFKWIPFNHAKGEILTLETDKILPDAVISCGKWCVPLGQGRYTVGSTYAWDHFNCEITPEAKREILSDIGEFIKAPFKVVGHMAGVRPIVKDLKPVLGLHPEHESIAIFNGLASKGLIWGPFYANQMTEFLVDAKPLETEVNVNRFR